ncbi:MAG: InlB B-repeat-containing protein [Firmicutes bacterium]|nr:InlB B-repeat-containing protein [Bacillota bacterium]
MNPTFLKNGSGKLSKNVFKRTGYRFEGWSTNKNATAATYADGSAVKFSQDTTVYAVWKLQ